MCRAINNITHLSRRNANRKQQPYEKDPYELPHKLKHVNYNKAWFTPDEQVQQTTERMQDELDNELRKSNRKNGHRQSNLSKGEMEGVKWLQLQINQDKLAVVQADKGGAIILTTPQLLKKKVLEK